MKLFPNLCSPHFRSGNHLSPTDGTFGCACSNFRIPTLRTNVEYLTAFKTHHFFLLQYSIPNLASILKLVWETTRFWLFASFFYHLLLGAGNYPNSSSKCRFICPHHFSGLNSSSCPKRPVPAQRPLALRSHHRSMTTLTCSYRMDSQESTRHSHLRPLSSFHSPD